MSIPNHSEGPSHDSPAEDGDFSLFTDGKHHPPHRVGYVSYGAAAFIVLSALALAGTAGKP